MVRLRNFEAMQELFCREEKCRLNFDKYIETRQALDNIANRICKPIGNGKRTLIAYGNGTTISPIISGYARVPNKGFLQALQRNKHADVFLVDEYRSTKTCSNCFESLEIQKSPSRLAYCQNNSCRVRTWNRDINAANNMITIIRCTLQDRERPPGLQRTGGTRINTSARAAGSSRTDTSIRTSNGRDGTTEEGNKENVSNLIGEDEISTSRTSQSNQVRNITSPVIQVVQQQQQHLKRHAADEDKDHPNKRARQTGPRRFGRLSLSKWHK